ncbi:uncharacterized protein LOC116424366 [Nomia melanderi]|uniref:uncharacterized protein LOC116424366 n=1 Tax=Nomia melanderi TaxID=2448451 RepID=UPI003FCE9C6A
MHKNKQLSNHLSDCLLYRHPYIMDAFALRLTSIVRKCLLLTIPICWLVLSVEFGAVQAERWSRQVSNSEWIPLPDPRTTQSQVEQNNPDAGLLASGTAPLPQVPQLSLPPALQQQYQDQLLQLQKTQESIQKLLLLQQQLRAQQQLLQSQTFLPSGFSNADEEKRLSQSGLGHSQTDLAPEDLVPPLPATEALPPVFPAQSFLPAQRPRAHPPAKHDNANVPQEFANLSGQGFRNNHGLQQEQNVGDVEEIQENQRPGGKHLKEPSQASLAGHAQNGQDEEEEVQLIYVPAETLSQRGQKRGRGRKQYPGRQQQQVHQQHHQQQQSYHQQHQQQGVEPSTIANNQDAFNRQILQQIQMEREEKTQFLNEERMKEIARLNEEQRALDRKARLQQEALQREQELQRQRDAEKKKKELEKLEEMAKQRELERIREAREKQRMEELERRRLAEIRAKEEKRRAEEAARQREAERLAALERQKELEIQEALKQQQLLEKQREEEARAASQRLAEQQEAQALPLIRDQQEYHRQHLPETPKPAKSKIRGRHRQRNQYQEQQNYNRETTTTAPSPNQPPLSVYMGNSNSRTNNAKVSDVLKLLKDAKTIAVLDTVGPDTPQVFVGPTNLDPPSGYAKFDLPYLSSIDHNRVERKVDKLPFFVAPLSFDPPPGYSKIPFPAPHIGSVVVNTLDNSLDNSKDGDDRNPSPTPLIEPNSYSDGLDGSSDLTTLLYEPQTTVGYSQDVSSTPKYEQSYSTTPSSGYSGSRFRFRQYYGDNKPASVISTAYYEDQRPTTRKQKYYDENPRSTERPRVETSISQVEEVSYSSTPSFKDRPVGPQDPTTKEQELAAQLALINQELAQQREAQRYNTGGQYGQDGSVTGLSNNFESDIPVGDVNDVRGGPVGPTQYSLPAELPAISPHLPGLVNSLLDKNEAELQSSTTTTTPSPTVITTTTQRTPTTTYRPRGRPRSRVSSTKPRTTTQASSTRVSTDRNRRPYNRSRSRFSTTTETYQDSYEPTKSRIPETTLRYNSEYRRPSSRTQKYRNREKTNQQSEILGQSQSPQSQQTYDVTNSDAASPSTGNGFLQSTGPETVHHQLDSSSGLSDFTPENYPSPAVSTTENYPSLRDATASHGSSLLSEDYSRTQNYPQTVPDQSHYRGGYEQAGVEHTGLEKTPVNGFNYQAQNSETLDQGILQRPKDYQLDGKAENSDYELATTPDPRYKMDEQRYSSIYDVNVPQTQPEYSLTGQDNLHRLESEKIQTGVIGGDPNQQPIFVPLPENKQEDYALPVSSTELPPEITTEITTTSTTPVVIRQRVRGRVSTRVHHEPSVQTRTRGTQDEYVRFNVVNQDSARTSSGRQRTRSRSRNQSHGSQVQTDGNEYIKIHAVQQHKQVATTTTTTSTTTTTEAPPEEDLDYGFIRPPNFRPVHPVDNRFQAPVTFRPQLSEVPQQSLLPSDETAVESSPPQTQLLKTRQKYQPTPNRRLPGKPTTLPATTTPVTEVATTTERIPVATVLPDDAIYTTRPKSRTDDVKQTRIRGRVRRPGKKRVSTTTTTESVLESHNELPLDENYPRVRPQPTTTEQQANLYEDSFDGTSQFAQNHNPTAQQYYETSSENYPSEFILNFGNYPQPAVQREEYDQTQLASSSPRKYSESLPGKHISEDSSPTTVDIYGAESQWSTKLTRTSFQPSFAVNQLTGEKPKDADREWASGSSKDAPDIITAAPEISSVTLLVSSDDKTVDVVAAEESLLMGTTVFGKKTNIPDHTEKINTNAGVTGAPTTATTREKNGSDIEANNDGESWLMDKVEGSVEQQTAIDFEKTRKKNSDAPVGRKGTRRRRVRVRVRPAVDDFVTAESQHYNSALNGLFREQYKYNPIRESKLPTPQPILSEKSVFQGFLTDILKNDEPTVKSTTTEIPEMAWTMSPAITTMLIPDDAEETTENQMTTVPPTTEKPEETTTAKPDEDNHPQLTNSDGKTKDSEKNLWSANGSNDEKKKIKDQWDSDKNDNWNGRTALDLNFLADKYTAKENDVSKPNDDWETSRSDEESVKTQLKLTHEETELLSKENLAVKDDQRSKDEVYAHPKNHRTKWSEVRFPSTFDQPQIWNQDPKPTLRSTTAIPGLVSKDDGDDSVKTLSDYVKAIFDTMKNAEEDTTVTNTEKSEEVITTLQTPLAAESESLEDEKTTTKDPDIATTVETIFDVEDAKTVRDIEASRETTTEAYIDPENATTLERAATTSETVTTGSPTEPPATDLPTTTPTSTTVAAVNSTESMLGRVLRTSTTTRVSHMTEICYRGRCVMTRPSQDDRFR